MSNKHKYNLNALEWQQFEVLSFKCLQFDISPSIQFLDGGGDKGRDIIYEGETGFFDSKNETKKIVFQVKHKSNETSYSSLKSDLLKELTKVYITHSWDYDFYCLVTNLTITSDQNDELNKAFRDFISENEIKIPIQFSIYSYRHFESCLDNNDTIKWIFPIIIQYADFKILLEKILTNQEHAFQSAWLSSFEKNRIRFVSTTIFDDAMEKIKENKVLLLSGPAKSGKTYNAEMILLNKFCLESYIPYKIDSIEAFERYYSKTKKQIFLFDDAFGKHNLEFYRADSFSRAMEYIFETVDDDHLCIFTSREYIFKAFLDYNESELSDIINKINVDVSNLSYGEKESIFLRYFHIKFPDKNPLGEGELNTIAKHKNFSPETIRAYFDNTSEFDIRSFKSHLDVPDKYLEKLFSNLSEQHKVVLLSVLFSLRGEESNIAYSFKSIVNDLNLNFVLSLKKELNVLEGSLIKKENERYEFHHPSMFDFFMTFLGSDIATYRNLLFKNLNIEFLSIAKFKGDTSKGKKLEINSDDILDLKIGFSRAISNPSITLFEINSLFAWLGEVNSQLLFKIKMKEQYNDFIESVTTALAKISYTNFKKEDIYELGNFFSNLTYYIPSKDIAGFIEENKFVDIIDAKKKDSNYWLLVFKISPFLSKEFVFKHINREWLNEFYKEVKVEIDYLGLELYGTEYPNFEQYNLYKRLMAEKKFTEANKIKIKTRADSMQKTNKNWYPRYKICKEKMYAMKSSAPFGYTIHQKLNTIFAHLEVLEEKQKNRYFFLKKKKWW